MRGTPAGLVLGAGFLAIGFLAVLPASTETPGETTETSVPEPLQIPDAARNRPNPVPRTPEAVERGKVYFSSQCAMCHGTDGSGKGDLVGRLKLELPDFRQSEFQKRWTDGELYYVITEGHGRMKGEGDRLPDDWKWDMIHFIRSLAP